MLKKRNSYKIDRNCAAPQQGGGRHEGLPGSSLQVRCHVREEVGNRRVSKMRVLLSSCSTRELVPGKNIAAFDRTNPRKRKQRRPDTGNKHAGLFLRRLEVRLSPISLNPSIRTAAGVTRGQERVTCTAPPPAMHPRSRDGSIAGTRLMRQGGVGINDIRDHKDDKAAVAQVAMRHRQKMQVQLEDTMGKYNQISRDHMQLQVSGESSLPCMWVRVGGQ